MMGRLGGLGLTAVTVALGIAVAAAGLAGAQSVSREFAEHPIWSEPEMLDEEQLERLRPSAGFGDEELVAVLDFLYEARSPVAAGRHQAALQAYLGLPRRQRKPLLRFLEGWARRAERLRQSHDDEQLRQLQTRVSVVTSELASREQELERKGGRRAAGRDLRLLCEFVEESVWARHELNLQLRGPLRQATAPAAGALERYYRKRRRQELESSSRAALLELVSEIEGGGFDAVNAYDGGGISLGIVQFSAASSFLGELLWRLRASRPRLFHRHFERRGLAVDEDGRLHLHERPLIEAIGAMRGQSEFNSVLLAFFGILDNRRLRKALDEHQMALADELIDRAMDLRTEDGRPAAQLLTSTRGRSHLADAYINTGASNTLETLAAARNRASDGGSLTEAFVAARRSFYERIGQPYQLTRIERLEAVFDE